MTAIRKISIGICQQIILTSFSRIKSIQFLFGVNGVNTSFKCEAKKYKRNPRLNAIQTLYIQYDLYSEYAFDWRVFTLILRFIS